MYEVELSESYFPAQGGDPARLMTIGAMLRSSAAATPDRPALKELGYDGEIGRVWTYADLLHDAERLARALASRHDEGARVAVYANNLPEWVLLELGCALAGVTLVTVNPAYRPRETDHDAMFAGEHEPLLRDPDPLDPAQIQDTSGTTGFPKGAVLHHQGLVQNAYDAAVRGGIEPGAVIVHHMPMFHTTGCAVLVCGVLGMSATMQLAPMFDPDMVVRVMERERAEFALGVPTMLVALVDAARRAGSDMSAVRRIMSGGAMVAPRPPPPPSTPTAGCTPATSAPWMPGAISRSPVG